MACCSLPCSRRTASSSCLSDCRLSDGPVEARGAGAFRRACVSAACLASRAARFSRGLLTWFRVSAVFVIMFISSYEFVTHSVHRQKITRLVRHWFEFLADSNDVRVHGPRRRKILITPNLIE